MRSLRAGALLLGLAIAACHHDEVLVVGNSPAPPVELSVAYYGGVVTVTWELANGWDGEAFRVYSKRATDPEYFLIAEVTSCAAGLCSYEDSNVAPGVRYLYFVSAYDPATGLETSSYAAIEVLVPESDPPTEPTALAVIALDDALYLRWSDVAREAADLSHYRVYLLDGSSEFFLGETDSEGFLDLLASNGVSSSYFVTAVDDQGHESDASLVASGTPRPDFHGEWLFDHTDQPALSGFRFQADESVDPVVAGASADRHFRLELDAVGWWLSPGPQAEVYPVAFETTALKCGVGADAGCLDVSTAPASGYVAQEVELFAQSSYVLRVVGDDARVHYGVIRVQLLGFDQHGDALMIFDWAYQLQADNPDLAVGVGG